MISTNVYHLLFHLLFFGAILSCSTKENKQIPNAFKTTKNNRLDQAYAICRKMNIHRKEDWIFDTIHSLEEVKKENAYLIKETKGKRNLSVVIYAFPTTTNNYYWIKVWEDNGDAYASHFNFHVYPKTRKIMYCDMVKDSLIELKDWKKNSKYFNFK